MSESNKNIKRLGIMGGTFDPIHYGHLVTAEEARGRFNLDKVVFVPSGKPPHKKGYRVTEARHRYLMTILAVATNPYFEVSRVEIDRSGYSYTVDTVNQFYEHFDDVELYFITGADAILEILTWKNVEELLSKTNFIAATRPGIELTQLDEVVKKLPVPAYDVIHPLEVPAMAISSTDIRSRVAEKRSIKYLLPEAVEHYIYKNRLYVED
ncbi:MAG: nicotinate-nucleotide adenylyltransferase [Thermoanaerobacteraceae bacterium]|nr:nicotinate-nucleotide adenylyltransferase [Thermoanaerobacteraceae bacterium]